MTKRNIAIANFSPQEVFNSSWPRFTGFKVKGNPNIASGMFGLVDRDVRMHAFFKDTNIRDVLRDRLKYSHRQEVNGSPVDITYGTDDVGTVKMAPPKLLDMSIRWLPPYLFTDSQGVEWDVYPVITGKDVHIAGAFHETLKTEGYWDMGIWQPKVEEGKEWTDIDKIEQSTINYVVSLGYEAMTNRTMFKDNPNYGKYHVVNVYQEVPK